MRENLVAFDFFCGIGGLTRGLLNAGILVKAGFDIDPTCADTFNHNNQPAKFHTADIRLFDDKSIREEIILSGSDNLVFTGCAPCQSFSKQRRSRTRRPDATVLGAFSNLVEKHLPGYVVIENVPGLSKVKGFSTYKRFQTMLRSNGYSFTEEVLDVKNYGVPQSRKRLVLIASRVVYPTIPAPTHGKGLKPFSTVRESISHYPPIKAGESHSTVANHSTASISPKNLERLEVTPLDGGDRRDWPINFWLECHKGNHQGHTDVYGRMFWDKPSPTLTGKCISISNGRYGHPEQNRALSLREAAALQSFDDDFLFFGPLRKSAQHIGNAVPVGLGEVIGNHLLELSKKGEKIK